MKDLVRDLSYTSHHGGTTSQQNRESALCCCEKVESWALVQIHEENIDSIIALAIRVIYTGSLV